jgi:RHS repeat-associated protein
MTVLFSVIPFLITLFLAGNVNGWTEDGEMLAAKVIDDPKARHTRFVWEGMRLLQEIGPTPDGEGKVRDTANERVRTYLYEPYGTGYALRFQGQYFDAETGLHYNTLRCYNPGCGRFISPDPINIQGGLNLYQYAPNAANWIDPWGWVRFEDAVADLESKGFKGVTTTAGGNLDYSKCPTCLYSRPGVAPVVEIQYSGDYKTDFERANAEAKIKNRAGAFQKATPSGYVWHHLDYDPKTGKGTMQLVKQNAHRGYSHKGGVAQYKAATGNAYKSPRYQGGKSC